MATDLKVTETSQYADSVFSSCQKAHVIGATGLPDTARIDASLVSKIAVISVPKQRELVNMLFFWEEEITRLRLLDTEEEEIKAAIGSHGETEDLSMALRKGGRVGGTTTGPRKGTKPCLLTGSNEDA